MVERAWVVAGRAVVVAGLSLLLVGLGASPASAQPPTAYDDQAWTGVDTPVEVYPYAEDPEFDELTIVVVDPPGNGTLDDCSDGVCTYTPATGFEGVDAFTFKANDGTADSNVATYEIVVGDPNLPPHVEDQQAQAHPGEPVFLSLSAYDEEADPLTFTVVDAPAHGSLDDCTDGECSYTPGAAYQGTDSFTWRANDGSSDSALATYSFVVDDDFAPVAEDQSDQVAANGALDLFLAASDFEFDALTHTIVSAPAHGSLDDCTDGFCTYTPDADYLGPDSFTWRANDGTSDSNLATYSLDVVLPPVSDLQVAGSGPNAAVLTWVNPDGVDGIVVRYSTEDTPLSPTEGSGVPVTGTPETVTVAGLIEGTTYFFSVFAQIGGGTSEPASVSFAPFSCPDLTPALDAGSLVTGQGWETCAGPLAHQPNSTVDTVLPMTGASQALMTSGNRDVALPPDDGAGEGESTGTGSRGAYDVSIYRIDVDVPTGQSCLRFDYVFASEEYPEFVGSSFNDGFVAQLDQHVWTVEDSNILATDNFARFSDGSFISVNSTVFADPSRVALPDTNGTGYDGMSMPLTASTPISPGPHSIYLSIFDAGDDALDSGAFIDNLRAGTGTCVAGSNQAPSAFDDETSTAEDTPTTIAVADNDTDADAGQTLAVVSHSDPANGTVSCTDGSCTYTPDADFHGTDSFTYTIGDGAGGTDTATVTVTVTPVNDPPLAVDDEADTTGGTAVVIDVLANDSDVEGSSLAITARTEGANGSVACSTTCTYTPNGGFTGTDSFTYTVSDGALTDTATVTVTVSGSGANTPPVAVDDTTSTAEDAAKAVSVLVNDSDVDGDALTVTGKTDGAHGSVTCSASVCTYTPEADFHGSDSFTYTISDGHGGTDTATVNVTVTAVDDAADVAVSKAPLAPTVRVGQLTGWRIRVTNTSGVAAGEVQLADVLPDGFVHKSVTPASCTVSAGELSCGWPSLAAGQTVEVVLMGAFTKAGETDNTATVATAGDPTPGNDTFTATTTVEGRSCTIVGTFGDDILLGTRKADVICGLAGNDRINGRGANDTLYGNEGNDRLAGLGGDDHLDGGPGSDWTLYSAVRQAVRVDLGEHWATGQGRDTLVSIEHVAGSAASDVIRGNGAANTLTGGGGNDQIVGRGGPDRLVGGSGRDLLKGGGGGDSIIGGTGADTCRPGAGKDTLRSC